MAMLADLVELVIGVDTHKHPHTAAVVGAVIQQVTVPATSSCWSSPTTRSAAGVGD